MTILKFSRTFSFPTLKAQGSRASLELTILERNMLPDKLLNCGPISQIIHKVGMGHTVGSGVATAQVYVC